ncbi:uncharacterized protein TNCV_2557891 [Trichonephila clavipes]|nr:uncharacterized protein TNCV_2557891 [Trichonephila clavipes]
MIRDNVWPHVTERALSEFDVHSWLAASPYLLHSISIYVGCYGTAKYKAPQLHTMKELRSTLENEELYHSVPSMHQGVRCQDSIFEWTIYEELEDVAVEVAGHFMSLSRSGLLAFWRRDLTKRFETKIAVLDDGDKMTTMATGLTCLPRYKMVAVATTSADIRFFSSDIYRFEHKFSILWLPAVLVNMHCYNSEKLSCGDFMGNVFIINLFEDFFKRVRRRANHLGPQKVTFEDLKKGRMLGLKFQSTAKSHLTNVAKVKSLEHY